MKAARILTPLLVVLVMLGLWEALVHLWQVPAFVLPPPSAIGHALVDDFSSLLFSAWMTLRISLTAFVLAVLAALRWRCCSRKAVWWKWRCFRWR